MNSNSILELTLPLRSSEDSTSNKTNASEINPDKCFYLACVSPKSEDRVRQFLQFAQEENITALLKFTQLEDIETGMVCSLLCQDSRDPLAYHLLVYKNTEGFVPGTELMFAKKLTQKLQITPAESAEGIPAVKLTYWKTIKIAFFGGKFE